MAICERIFINLLILYYGILRSKRLLMVGVCVCGASYACCDDNRQEDFPPLLR